MGQQTLWNGRTELGRHQCGSTLPGCAPHRVAWNNRFALVVR